MVISLGSDGWRVNSPRTVTNIEAVPEPSGSLLCPAYSSSRFDAPVMICFMTDRDHGAPTRGEIKEDEPGAQFRHWLHVIQYKPTRPGTRVYQVDLL
jgi:hypothetical protein